MPDPPDLLPKVVLATVESWPAKSRWFYEVNEPQFAADDAIRAKVAELRRRFTPGANRRAHGRGDDGGR